MFRVCSTKTHLTADLRGFRGNLRIEDVVTREPIFDITVSKSTSTIKWNAYQANNHPWMKEVEYMTSRYTTFSTCADLWELGRRFGFEPMRLRDIAIRRKIANPCGEIPLLK